jgi:hypothetical protein
MTKQTLKVELIREIANKSLDAIRTDIASLVFTVDFHSAMDYGDEEKKAEVVGKTMLQLEQAQDKEKTVLALIEKYNALEGEEYHFEME